MHGNRITRFRRLMFKHTVGLGLLPYAHRLVNERSTPKLAYLKGARDSESKPDQVWGFTVYGFGMETNYEGAQQPFIKQKLIPYMIVGGSSY